ncbi:MAG: hypothetical protein FWC62_09975 [Firmicutes bacterium]|nr:hypothetical protein [Bacillota bacterium]
MRIKTAHSYNLDMFCFLNVMTADDCYVRGHPEAFSEWYPRLSAGIKTKAVASDQSEM